MSRFNTLLSLFCTSLLLFLPISLYGQDDEASDPAAVEEDLSAVKPMRSASALPRVRYPRDEQNYMEVLASYLPEEGLVWVEHNPEPFLAYWQEDRSGEPKGALLILHNEGATPVWQNTTAPLHESLPEYGWSTFALSLPQQDDELIPKRSFPVKTIPKVVEPIDEGEQAAENIEAETPAEAEPNTQDIQESIAVDNTIDRIPASEIIEQRLESALRFLHDKGQFNIVVLASGVNAIAAQNFIDKITPKVQNPELKNQLEKPVRAMVLVNSLNRLGAMEKEFEGWFGDKDMPILDIYFKQNIRSHHDAQKRRQLAKMRGVKLYQQVAINEVSGERSWGENKFSRRVRSFLNKNAAGVEVNRAAAGR